MTERTELEILELAIAAHKAATVALNNATRDAATTRSKEKMNEKSTAEQVKNFLNTHGRLPQVGAEHDEHHLAESLAQLVVKQRSLAGMDRKIQHNYPVVHISLYGGPGTGKTRVCAILDADPELNELNNRVHCFDGRQADFGGLCTVVETRYTACGLCACLFSSVGVAEYLDGTPEEVAAGLKTALLRLNQ